MGSFGAEASSGEISSEPLLHRVLTRPAFAQVDWSPKVPLLQACLPVFMVRSLIRKRLMVEIYSFLGACAQHIEDGLEEGVHEALSLMGAEIEKRAVEIESRISQAVKGKRLLKDLDGHWQIHDLDRSELTIERRLGSIRTDMLKAEPASGKRPSLRSIVQAPRLYAALGGGTRKAGAPGVADGWC